MSIENNNNYEISKFWNKKEKKVKMYYYKVNCILAFEPIILLIGRVFGVPARVYQKYQPLQTFWDLVFVEWNLVFGASPADAS